MTSPEGCSTPTELNFYYFAFLKTSDLYEVVFNSVRSYMFIGIKQEYILNPVGVVHGY